MSSSTIHVCAIITPAQGKEARVRELLTELAENVQKNEADVSKYQLFEQYDSQSGSDVFVVQETYKDKSTFDAHLKTSYFTALGEKIPQEALLAAPINIMTIKPIGGFVSR